MFSNKASCFLSLVLLSLVCGQALGYERKSSGQKYLVKTGNNSPAKHLLVETEDADYDPEEYDSEEGNIIVPFKIIIYHLFFQSISMHYIYFFFFFSSHLPEKEARHGE